MRLLLSALVLSSALPAAAQVRAAAVLPGARFVAGYANARLDTLTRLSPLESARSIHSLRGLSLPPMADNPERIGVDIVEGANAAINAVRMFVAQPDWWKSPARRQVLEETIGTAALERLEAESARLESAAAADPETEEVLRKTKSAFLREEVAEIERLTAMIESSADAAAAFDGDADAEPESAPVEPEPAEPEPVAAPAPAPAPGSIILAKNKLPGPPLPSLRLIREGSLRPSTKPQAERLGAAEIWQSFTDAFVPVGEDQVAIEQSRIPTPPLPPNTTVRQFGPIAVETKASKLAHAEYEGASAMWDRFMAVITAAKAQAVGPTEATEPAPPALPGKVTMLYDSVLNPSDQAALDAALSRVGPLPPGVELQVHAGQRFWAGNPQITIVVDGRRVYFEYLYHSESALARARALAAGGGPLRLAWAAMRSRKPSENLSARFEAALRLAIEGAPLARRGLALQEPSDNWLLKP